MAATIVTIAQIILCTGRDISTHDCRRGDVDEVPRCVVSHASNFTPRYDRDICFESLTVTIDELFRHFDWVLAMSESKCRHYDFRPAAFGRKQTLS